MRFAIVAATLVVTMLAGVGTARAQATARIQVCVGDADAGQVLRSAGKLREARDKFRRCADAACPSAVRTDCTAWVKEMDGVVPTLDVRVRNPSASTVGGGVTIMIDGRRADRASLEVDPGPHVVRAVASDGRTAEASCVIAEGERYVLAIELQPAPPAPAPPPSPAPSSSGIGAPVFIGLGVATLALGAGAIFGVRARSEYNDLEGRCAPSCDHDAVSSARTTGVVADVFLVTGVVALAVTGILFFTSRGPRGAVSR